MEIVKWWVYLILLFFAIALFMFFFQAGQTSRFEGYVDTQIERYAGLTPQAVANIKEESANYYDGRYVVLIDEDHTSSEVTYSTDSDGYNVMKEPLAFGDVVAYEVQATYPILFNWINPIEISTSGQAIIQVRGSAGR